MRLIILIDVMNNIMFEYFDGSMQLNYIDDLERSYACRAILKTH
jgi:hypothetical protein